MEEQLKVLQGMIDENSKIPEAQQTPYLHMAIGGMRTALDNIKSHIANPPKPATASTAEK